MPVLQEIAARVASTPSSATVPVSGIAAPAAVRGFGRSFLCALTIPHGIYPVVDCVTLLQQSRLGERAFYPKGTSKKSFSGASCPILAWSILRSGSSALALGPTAKYVGSRFLQLLLPLRYLVRVNLEVFGQLGQCLVSPDCGQGHFGFESRCVVPSRPSHALAPLVAVTCTAWVEQG